MVAHVVAQDLHTQHVRAAARACHAAAPLLACASLFAASLAAFLDAFPSGLADPLAHVFADLGWRLPQPLAHRFATLLGAWGRGLAPHRPLTFLGTDKGSEQTQYEDQAFQMTASGARPPATRFAARNELGQ